MSTNAIFLAALTFGFGQADQLSLTNVRTTYGLLGATRPDNKILPGDAVVLSFDIEGAKANAQGKVLYSMGMEVSDDKGKVLYKQVPKDLEAPMPAGSKGLPAAANVRVSLDQAPGDFTLKVKVTDRASGAIGEVSRTYEILPKAFGVVRVTTTTDQEGQKAVVSFQSGKSFWINFSAVGFDRDKTSGQPNITTELRIRDETGRQILSAPSTGEVNKDVPAKQTIVPLQFELELNRTGTFTIELKATDKIADKTATLSFPVTVGKSR
jgi:hypothetical protein